MLNLIFRVLKRGGRLAVSDMVASGKLTDELRGDLASYSACIAGASPVDELTTMIKSAGFTDVGSVAAGAILVCTHNSARSQMAEAYLRKFGGDRYEVESAGLEARMKRSWPRCAVCVMQSKSEYISSRRKR
ncbi:MAG: hypothetical protein ACLQCB_13160 [Spirochaetia bacterium]